MKETIERHVVVATSLSDVERQLVTGLRFLREVEGVTQIGYVAGVITSDGKEFINRNRVRLSHITVSLRRRMNIPLFCAPDVFTDQVYEQLSIINWPQAHREAQFTEFWRNILSSGLITDVIMTPQWERSKGANDEHATAIKLGLSVQYIEAEIPLEPISKPILSFRTKR